jgi:hypothetical protein
MTRPCEVPGHLRTRRRDRHRRVRPQGRQWLLPIALLITTSLLFIPVMTSPAEQPSELVRS